MRVQTRNTPTPHHNPIAPPSVNPDQRLTVKQLAALLGIGVSTAWKMSSDGRLPVPEKYGNRCSRWRYGDIFPHQVS